MSEKVRDAMAASSKGKATGSVDGDTGQDDARAIANLPYARGKTFNSLDDYLAHLEHGGAIDLPWWREIRPGVYEYVTTRTGAEAEIATREELMNRFGFER